MKVTVMKKLIAFALVIALCVSFMAACAKKTADPTDPAATTAPSTPTTPSDPTNATDPADPSDPTDPVDPTDPTDPSTPADPTDPSTPANPTNPTQATQPSQPTEPEIVITKIADILKMNIAENVTTTERYYIEATIESISNSTYGAMVITDGTGSISVYGTYSADGAISYAQMTDKPYKGDKVLLHCTIQNYKGTLEVKNARLISFTHVETEIDESQYTQMSIKDARDTAIGTKVKVQGVVAQLTYAFGKVPSGFILVDGTNAIYVYGKDIAAQVAVGNKVTVAASKTYWILEDEVNNANKFGYKGCNQLEEALLLSNDKMTNDFDKSWITATTVKDIMDTPVTTDITTTIFKVTALVRKVPGSGFTNYYINDLDGKTGSYCYTQCNGNDFAWLDKFDGKICTVYLTVINAKSTGTGCQYRFLPVQVIDEAFNVNTVNGAEYAVKYEGIGQFQPSYTGNPKLELLTSVSSELLNINNAKLSYSSSNTSVISFTEADGKVIMNCLSTGKATVTVTGSYNGKTYSETIEINVTVAQTLEHTDVAGAIAATVGDKVTVKGIVGPSLVNKVGFYLIDDTGVIAVLVNNADIMDTIEIGQEVILEGLRDRFIKDGSTHHGQTCITGATIQVNNYGKHEYSTKTFITDKTLTDVAALDITEDYTTTVYVLKATVKVVESQYSTNIYLEDGNASVMYYCSGTSTNQYRWLIDYAGQEVTLELAPCNWNSKSPYKVCVLAVHTADGKVVNALNFN